MPTAAARQALLAADGEAGPAALELELPAPPLDRKAVACLALQHASSTFGDGCYNFAVFLFLVDAFPSTLVPASLVGLCTTASGLVLASYVGGLVDGVPRLALVRRAVLGQKLLQAATFALVAVLLGPMRDVAERAFRGDAGAPAVIAVWTTVLAITAASSGVELANAGLNLAVERDWVTAIADGSPAHLTTLNTYMRRIDLLSKLTAPLVVSAISTATSSLPAAAVLFAAALATAVTETLWIGVVYAGFPVLAKPRRGRTDGGDAAHGWDRWLRDELRDWNEFVRLPVFYSSLAIAAIYLTTLSYDGTFIAYVKVARGYHDTFIAAMRALSVFTGLLGTVLMTRLERLVGVHRAGAWSLWLQVACLAPALAAFFVGTGPYGTHGPAWNAALLFGGIALSRIGLWSFDLCQLKTLQLSLEHHDRPGRLAAMQVALQNVFTMAKYVVTLLAASPRDFKWTALVSWIAVVCGASCYTVFLRSERGHLVHMEWVRKYQ